MIFAAIALASGLGPIGKFDVKPPFFSITSPRKLEDVERCIINVPKFGPANVYRQPDRPDQVTITWSAGGGTTVARVDLARREVGVLVTSWLELKEVQGCF